MNKLDIFKSCIILGTCSILGHVLLPAAQTLLDERSKETQQAERKDDEL